MVKVSGSMTGVPVMPRGSILPQGRAERGTGMPRLVSQTVCTNQVIMGTKKRKFFVKP